MYTQILTILEVGRYLATGECTLKKNKLTELLSISDADSFRAVNANLLKTGVRRKIIPSNCNSKPDS